MNAINLETKQEIEEESQDPLFHILEKQAKEIENFGKRMSLEIQSSYQDYLKQKNAKLLRSHHLEKKYDDDDTCHKCKEKNDSIIILKARIQELENDSKIKDQDIKKLQKDFQSLYNIIIKKGIANAEEIDDSTSTKITVIAELCEEEEIYDSESTKQDIKDYNKEIDKNKLSVENFQYRDDLKDSYSDSAVDLFTDDDYDGSSTAGESVETDNYEDSIYDHPSEWLDVSTSFRQRSKFDKKNLDNWNSKMASNGLIPIRLVGKVDEEEEKKIQTHRKRYSTSAIWLKTYEESKIQSNQNHDEKFKIPSFNFPFKTTDSDDINKSKQKQKRKRKQKDLNKISAPISLKSSVSTSVSDLYTTSLVTTATTSLQPYKLLEHHKNSPINYSKSQQLLSQYK